MVHTLTLNPNPNLILTLNLTPTVTTCQPVVQMYPKSLGVTKSVANSYQLTQLLSQ